MINFLKNISVATVSTAAIGLSLMGTNSAQAANIVSGSITENEVDYWNFSIDTAGKVAINVDAYGLDFGNGTSYLDSYIYLFQNDGSLDAGDYIIRNDDYGDDDFFYYFEEEEYDYDFLGSTSYLDSYLPPYLDAGNYTLAISSFFLSLEGALSGYNDSGYSTGDYQIIFSDNVNIQSVPEPASALGLLAVGALGVGTKLKKKQQG